MLKVQTHFKLQHSRWLQNPPATRSSPPTLIIPLSKANARFSCKKMVQEYAWKSHQNEYNYRLRAHFKRQQSRWLQNPSATLSSSPSMHICWNRAMVEEAIERDRVLSCEVTAFVTARRTARTHTMMYISTRLSFLSHCPIEFILFSPQPLYPYLFQQSSYLRSIISVVRYVCQTRIAPALFQQDMSPESLPWDT